MTCMMHMQTLQRSTFDVIAGVSAEENTLAFCAIADVAIGDVVLAEWHNTTYRCGYCDTITFQHSPNGFFSLAVPYLCQHAAYLSACTKLTASSY